MQEVVSSNLIGSINKDLITQRPKKDAEAQLDRIRQGKSPLAARLLADGIPITDVLFGSPEVALPISKEDGNESPLPLVELTKAYLAGLPGSVSPEHRYTVELWLKHVREFLDDVYRYCRTNKTDQAGEGAAP